MNAEALLTEQWPYLLSFLPPSLDLEHTARDSGALVRRRSIGSAEDLLRLALVYGFCGFSLRQTAAWAEVANLGSLSDVAVLKRLRRAAPWLGQILGSKLADRAEASLPADLGFRLRLVDATTVSRPGSLGTDWRVHMGVDLKTLAIDHIDLTDYEGGETLRRFRVEPNEILVGDAGYAHRQGLAAVRQAKGHFLVRLNWQNVPLQNRQGEVFEILPHLREIPDATVREFPVQTAPDPKRDLDPIPARLVALPKSEAAAAEARRKVMQARSKKGRSVDPRTLEAAGYVFVLISLPDGLLRGDQVLELYRFRWQIEMAFKRLKSVLYLDQLPAKDPNLSRSYLYAKLLAALLLDDFSEKFLAFSPWGYPVRRQAAEPVEDP